MKQVIFSGRSAVWLSTFISVYMLNTQTTWHDAVMYSSLTVCYGLVKALLKMQSIMMANEQLQAVAGVMLVTDKNDQQSVAFAKMANSYSPWSAAAVWWPAGRVVGHRRLEWRSHIVVLLVWDLDWRWRARFLSASSLTPLSGSPAGSPSYWCLETEVHADSAGPHWAPHAPPGFSDWTRTEMSHKKTNKNKHGQVISIYHSFWKWHFGENSVDPDSIF